MSSAVISDIDEARFKNINDLSYDIWCNTLDSKIHMEVNIPNMLEKVKTFNKGSRHDIWLSGLNVLEFSAIAGECWDFFYLK